MPQQHNPGRHVQSLTLPQSRHNHRNTSAYIFPTVPTPRTTPPTPGTASPRRRAPTLQLPVATLPCHSRHSPAAEHRPHTVPTPRPPHRHRATPRRRAPTLQLPDATLPPHSRHTPAAAHRLHTVPTPRTTPLTQEHAPRRALPRLTAGPQCSNSPSQLARLIQGTPLPPHNGSTVPTPRTIPPTPEPATRRALPHLTAGTQRSNIPPQLASAIQDTSPPPHNGPHTIPTPRTTPPTPGPAPRRAQKIRLCEPDLFICQ